MAYNSGQRNYSRPPRWTLHKLRGPKAEAIAVVSLTPCSPSHRCDSQSDALSRTQNLNLNRSIPDVECRTQWIDPALLCIFQDRLLWSWKESEPFLIKAFQNHYKCSREDLKRLLRFDIGWVKYSCTMSLSGYVSIIFTTQAFSRSISINAIYFTVSFSPSYFTKRVGIYWGTSLVQSIPRIEIHRVYVKLFKERIKEVY